MRLERRQFRPHQYTAPRPISSSPSFSASAKICSFKLVPAFERPVYHQVSFDRGASALSFVSASSIVYSTVSSRKLVQSTRAVVAVECHSTKCSTRLDEHL